MRELPEPFKSFWAAYPRKVGLKVAQSIYGQITGNGRLAKARDSAQNTYELDLYASPEDLLSAAKVFAYRMTEENVDKEFIPHPKTWLNQGRFEDEFDHIEYYMEKIERVDAAKVKLKLVK